MRVRVFGTYDAAAHPRVQVLVEGLKASGVEVTECNAPLGFDTAARVRLLRRPWSAPALAGRVALAWWALWRAAGRLPSPDVVVVGYLGALDVHLARRLHPRVPMVLDQLVALGDTALDRGTRPGLRVRMLAWLDQAAAGAVDLVLVDTEEHRAPLPEGLQDRAVVVPVGAPSAWFSACDVRTATAGPLRVVFFGLYTPLQGAPVIGEALALLESSGAPVHVTMVGEGQDLAETRRRAGGTPRVTWVNGVDPVALPALVAGHDVCLGIFGTGPKSWRVVPNKVFQGAAAGCAVVTSRTPPQVAALREAGRYVEPGDAAGLAATLAELSRHPDQVARLRRAARARAEQAFRPETVIAPLVARLAEVLAPR